MRAATILLTAAVLLTGATACSSSDDDKPAVSKASTTQADETSPSPSPTPSPEKLKVGDTASISTSDAKFTATVLKYQDKGIKGVPEMLSAGQKWAALEVKVCNTGTDGFGISPLVWSLAYADGARIEAAGMNAGELPQPLYPMDAKVKVGDCVRGYIAFQVPQAGRPERVLYSPDSLDEPAEWWVK
ncbi:DUF4352 domain-containing protein [Streptomyces canus]|uniref:DUF4352 domain-containing protein n=1 Tax=Streptomyces canus TaxID=58343 RepID=UPI003867F89C|nr:DUF4352 domain-containing protein [Streptomyces canus]